MSRWTVKVGPILYDNREPWKVTGDIEYIEREVNGNYYRIHLKDYLKYPFVKTTGGSSVSIFGGVGSTIHNRIVGIYINPNPDKYYDVYMKDVERNLLFLNIDEVDSPNYKDWEEDRIYKKKGGRPVKRVIAMHNKGWYSIKPRDNKYYRIEVVVNPKNDSFHLETEEVNVMSKDGF